MSKKYNGTLTLDETRKFLSDFYELGSSLGAKVTVIPTKTSDLIITIEPSEENYTLFAFIDNSFEKGLLSRSEWNLRFNKE